MIYIPMWAIFAYFAFWTAFVFVLVFCLRWEDGPRGVYARWRWLK